jgi:hypothetical protein
MVLTWMSPSSFRVLCNLVQRSDASDIAGHEGSDVYDDTGVRRRVGQGML